MIIENCDQLPDLDGRQDFKEDVNEDDSDIDTFDQTPRESERTTEIAGENQRRLDIYYVLLALAVLLFSTIFWKLITKGTKTPSTENFCGNVVHKHEVDGETYVFSIYEYVNAGYSCDNNGSENRIKYPDLAKSIIEIKNKTGGHISMLQLGSTVGYTRVLVSRYTEVLFNGILWRIVDG
ncbi:uncharacterized protein SPAR_M00610 [Saccharomyces paradoxus]|uniref:Uncharacterized protein n=1 Tax=Saccharomyces paradoxus TaxID=27291 RepID=A0A8B8UX02_SACPA|nr:uncharacterized protein SPAR_M00610 [Saccharomyces paradoxus]QHS75216.1 hypothetical protein SPAR_M00610 [Saccharomyces paradoxus]